MAVADLIKRVRQRGRDAHKTARELAVTIVEGADVNDEAIDEVCRNAGMAYEDFALLLAKLEARKAAFEKFHERNYDGEIAETRKKYRQVNDDMAAVKEEVSTLQAEVRRLSGVSQGLLGTIPRLEGEKKAAVEAFQAALGNTPRDWREV